MEAWGHPTGATKEQRFLWDRMKQKWHAFANVIPEPSLDIGAATKKGRTVSLDPFPRGAIDIRAVAENLPLKNSFFKSVVLESVLKHVCNPLLVLQESRRVSQEGSYLFLTSPVNVVDKHRHSFTSSELIDIIQKAGYKILKSGGFGFSRTRLDRLLRKLGVRVYLAIAIPRRFCRILMVVAQAENTSASTN